MAGNKKESISTSEDNKNYFGIYGYFTYVVLVCCKAKGFVLQSDDGSVIDSSKQYCFYQNNAYEKS